MRKPALLTAAFALAFGTSSFSAKAGANLLTNGSFENAATVSTSNGWTVTSAKGSVVIDTRTGDQFSGTQSAEFGPTSDSYGYGSISQTFPTVAGSNYIVQFTYKTLDFADTYNYSYVAVSASDSMGSLISYNEDPNPPGTFTTRTEAFVANTGSSTIYLSGQDQIILDNVIVMTGSFSNPGKYSGKGIAFTSLPSQRLFSFHTESIVARITPSGGFYAITQPDAQVFSGAFLNNGKIIVSGSTVAVTIHGGKVKFSEVSSNDDANGIMETDTNSFTLTRTGN